MKRRAVAAFAEAYAEQNERDYAALLDAIATGRIPQSTISEPLCVPAADPGGVAVAWQRPATESVAGGSLTTREERWQTT